MSYESRVLVLAIVALLTLLVSGCAGRGPAAVTRLQAKTCDTRWNTANAQNLQVDSVRPVEHRFEAGSPCLAESDGSAATYTVFRLPRYREDYTLRIDSQINGRSLFAPEVMTLDAAGNVQRVVTFDRFSLRGDHLQSTMFFSQDNAGEQYLLMRSARQVVGQGERRVVSSSFVIPLVAGVLPFLYMQGTESEGEYTYSHNGVVRLQARSNAPSLRRNMQARDVARSEIGTFVR
jgi:hypothetical protein